MGDGVQVQLPILLFIFSFLHILVHHPIGSVILLNDHVGCHCESILRSALFAKRFVEVITIDNIVPRFGTETPVGGTVLRDSILAGDLTPERFAKGEAV
jgi:hypothetical protein